MYERLSELSPYLVPLACMIVIFLMMRRLRQSAAPPRFTPPPTPRERFAPLPEPKADAAESLRSAPQEVARWQVAMHETARDLMAELQTRTAAVQALCLLADEHSQRLLAAIHKAEQLGLSTRPELLNSLEQLDAAKVSLALAAMPLPRDGQHPRRREIHQLSEQGVLPGDIASQLGMGRGEVELVLSLPGG